MRASTFSWIPAIVAALLAGCSPSPDSGERVQALAREAFDATYRDNCAVCHGERMEGTAQGVALIGGSLIHGDSVDLLSESIANGFPDQGMPGWSAVMSETSIRNIAIYVAEYRAGIFDFWASNQGKPFELPGQPIQTDEYAMCVDLVKDGLDPLPYSIAPLPNGDILLSEKLRGLSVLSSGGVQSALILGMPRFYDDAVQTSTLKYGNGWILDVAVHPDYAQNGWVYVSYGDRCEDCNAASREAGRPVSMVKLIRGRIRDGAWVDQEVIWQTDIEYYPPTADVMTGGRIAFDGRGHVFLSVGDKGLARRGIQDLDSPFGKIHRVDDDGKVPADNPFRNIPGALSTTWTYGHRSPHGLEYDPVREELWETEMGPRGGDELNRLVPGSNYGWPLYSLGVEYEGRPVDEGPLLGITWSLDDIVQPVVDLTPGPAVSSFVIYAGNAFPAWQGNFLVGSLKATNLYRFVIEGDVERQRELLLTGLGRIRDIEVGTDGNVLLLLEHEEGGKIVRLRRVAGSDGTNPGPDGATCS